MHGAAYMRSAAAVERGFTEMVHAELNQVVAVTILSRYHVARVNIHWYDENCICRWLSSGKKIIGLPEPDISSRTGNEPEMP